MLVRRVRQTLQGPLRLHSVSNFTYIHVCIETNYFINSHEKTHSKLPGEPATEAKKFSEQCELCGKEMKTRGSLKYHLQITHGRQSENIKCTECDLIFTHRSAMSRHRNKVHYPDRYTCPTCGLSFGSSSEVARHSLKHEVEGRFPCEICGRKFKMECKLKAHIRWHKGEKPFGYVNFVNYSKARERRACLIN